MPSPATLRKLAAIFEVDYVELRKLYYLEIFQNMHELESAKAALEMLRSS